MSSKVIKTEAEYKTAVKRSMEIFHAEEGTPEVDEFDLLLVLLKDYEDKNIHMEFGFEKEEKSQLKLQMFLKRVTKQNLC